MIKSDRKVKDLSALLSQNNNLAISAGIELLRENEPFEGAISLLASYYDNTDDSMVRKTIENFLNDLKDQSVASEVMEEIKKPFRHDTMTMLIASCWQSGLNYSGYCDELAAIFLSSDYLTALECFTVIEESIHYLSREKKNEIICAIKEFPDQMGLEKRKLTDELIFILSHD